MASVWMERPRHGLSRRVPRTAVVRHVVILLAISGLWIAPAAAQTTTPAPPGTAPSSEPAELSPIQLSVSIASTNDAANSLQDAIKLVSIGTPDAIEAVVSIIKTENNHAAKLAICQAVAQVKAVEPVYKLYLLKMLSHPEMAVQKAAHAALTNYPDPDVIAALQTYHHQEQQRLLREALTRNAKARYEVTPAADRPTLLAEWLGSTLAIEQMIAMDYIHADLRKGTLPAAAQRDQIRSLLTSLDVDVHLEAILIIRDCHQMPDAALIRSQLDADRPVAIREAVYNTLGKLAAPASLQTCIAGLKDPVETVAAEAAAALGRVAELKTGITPKALDAAVKALLARADQPMTNPKLRENMLDTMATIGDKTFVPIMVRHAGASETDTVVRQAAIRGLGKIADPAQVPLIIQQLGDADVGVRTSAVTAIERIFQGQLAAGKKDDAAAILEKAIDATANDLQTPLAVQLIDLYLSNPAPDKALSRAVRLQPKAREAVAEMFHQYATKLSTTDQAKALAFIDELKKQIPDQFGATWAPKFDALRNSIQPTTQPTTTPTK